jgi:type IV pilus assembly protein PilQ
MDNTEAKIQTGEKIPITVLTANGPSTRFVDANLSLTVTPHVTSDGSVMMKITATKNELSQRQDILGTPGIITREASTEMLVRDGDTAVLGGIYRRTASQTAAYVPWIGQIPVLGWLFKKTSRNDSREELLIFISPRIVNRSQALVTAR